MPLSAPDAKARLVGALRDARDAGEKVVVHCKLGQQRTGLALAAWLAEGHGLSAEEASARVEAAAREAGAEREVDVAKLKALLSAQPPASTHP